jgi:hypothetical protein
MKTFKSIAPILLSISLASLAACSSAKTESAKEFASSGPTVVDVKTEPGTFNLTQNLEPVGRTEVIANIKDFNNKVSDVRLRFTHIPMEIPMKQVSSSTWVADLGGSQLKQLAVNGHTMKYEANVIARDDKGQTGVSSSPIEIAVKAPDINSTG